MKRLVVYPDGLPTTIDEIQPGLFVTVDEPFDIGIKDEYDGHGYCTSGEYWCSKCRIMSAHIEVEDDDA